MEYWPCIGTLPVSMRPLLLILVNLVCIGKIIVGVGFQPLKPKKIECKQKKIDILIRRFSAHLNVYKKRSIV